MQSNQDLLKIIETAKDKNVRKEAISKITDEEILINIATDSNQHPGNRITAIQNENFKNQEILTIILLNDSYNSVRLACLKKITDPDYLFNILESSMYNKKFSTIKLECFKKMDLSDKELVDKILDLKMGLTDFGYVLNSIDDLDYFSEKISRNLDRLISWYGVGDMKNEKALCIIACFHPDKDAKLWAVENPYLRDEKLIMYTIKHLQSHKYSNLRKILYQKITDIDNLVYIAKYDPESDIRQNAEEKILSLTDDESIIQEIHENNPKSRLNHLKNITDEEELIQIAKNDTNINVRKAAIDKIDNEEVLRDIAKNDGDYCVSAEAMSNMDGDEKFIEIFENIDLSLDNRLEALKFIKNTNYLFDVATKYRVRIRGGIVEPLIRCKATNLISNQKRLFKIATGNNWDLVKLEAVKNPHLTNNEYLLKIVQIHAVSIFSDDKEISKVAINKMTNPKRLRLLLKDDIIRRQHGDTIKKRLSEIENTEKN